MQLLILAAVFFGIVFLVVAVYGLVNREALEASDAAREQLRTGASGTVSAVSGHRLNALVHTLSPGGIQRKKGRAESPPSDMRTVFLGLLRDAFTGVMLPLETERFILALGQARGQPCNRFGRRQL